MRVKKGWYSKPEDGEHVAITMYSQSVIQSTG